MHEPLLCAPPGRRRPNRQCLLPVLALVPWLGLLIACQEGAVLAPRASGGTSADSDGSHSPLGGAPGLLPGEEGGSAGAGAASAEEACTRTAEDEPDDRFEDTNCDGIDGDLRRAVFVSVFGDDSGAGTLEAPLATLEAAIALSRAENKDVYVCNGSYEQAVSIRQSGVRLFGGYACDLGGRRVPDRARFHARNTVPLKVQGVHDVVLDRLTFVAPDVSEGSSVAGAIENSTGIVLRRVELRSGRAGPGRDGAMGLGLEGRGPTGADGGIPCDQLLCTDYAQGGYLAVGPRCEGGELPEPGGAGGDGGYQGVLAQAGQPSPSGVAGGVVSGELSARDGQSGGEGARGDVGSLPARGIGDVAGSAYAPTNAGGVGGYGRSGRGGGGGAGVGALHHGDLCCKPGDAGSQGGFGGCGGRPGTGGTGGGASIALMVKDSDVTLTWTRLVAGDGGKGGAGGRGGVAQAGGLAGQVYSPLSGRLGGIGGQGGPGGPGGSGGPGGGGPSLGLALSGSPRPHMEGVQVLLGLPGFGGDAALDALAGQDGPDGLAVPGYDFTTHEQLTF